MPDIGPLELIIIAAIVLLLFGPGKAADLGSSLGKSISEFRKETRDDGGDKAAVQQQAVAAPEAAATISTNGTAPTAVATNGAAPAEVSKTRFCTNCGAPLATAQKFCTGCGTAVASGV